MESTNSRYMNHQSEMNNNRETDTEDRFSPYYRASKNITILLYSHVLELMSILCVISCIMLLLLCTWVLTMSLYINEMINNNYNKNSLPNLKMVIQVYIGTISEQISNYITLSKLFRSNIIIKQESDLSSNSSEESMNEQISEHDNWEDDDEVEYSDSQSIPSNDSTIDNSINTNENVVRESTSSDSDIEDITEEVLQIRILNRDIVDLTNAIAMETSSDSDTNNSHSRQSSVNSDLINESLDEDDLETKKNN
jgi:hypothetical protein|tara:strand:+ start:205 stop:963 length:759 start_codon:yes stop_codon:yes gene_type:complete